MAIENINKLVENGLQESELQQAKIELQKMQKQTPSFVPEALAILKEAILHSEAAKTERDALIAEFEKPQFLSHWYEQLTEEIEDHGWISRVMEQFQHYINAKFESAETEFSSSEKDSIKIVMWWEFQKLFTTDTALGRFIENTWTKVSDAIQEWFTILYKKDGSQKSISQIASDAELALEGFWKTSESNATALWYLDSHIWDTFQDILTHKEINPTKDLDIPTTYKVISGETLSPEKIYDTIKSHTLEIGKDLSNHKELWEKLATQIDSLPLWLPGKLRDVVSGIAESFPILAWVIGIIMGEDFLSEFLSGKQKKRKDSLNQLAALQEQDNSPVNWFFENSWIQKLDPKKLDGFFDYAESQDIDHNDENFWEEIVTGKTKNPKTQEIHLALKWNNSTAIEKSDFKNNGAWFLKKLNRVEASIHEKTTIEEQKQLETSAASLPPVIAPTPVVTTQTPTKTKIDTPRDTTHKEKSDFSLHDVHGKQEVSTVPPVQKSEVEQVETKENTEALKKQYTQFRDNVLTLALKQSTKLPMNISYQGKEAELQTLWIEAPKTLDFKEGKLVIGDKKYVIDFDTFTHKYLGYVPTSVSDLRIQKISKVSVNNITLSVVSDEHKKDQEQDLEKSEFTEIILWVLEKNTYNSQIPASGNNSEIRYQVLEA